MPRLPPDARYPAGVRGVSARFVKLRTGLSVRLVEAGDAAADAVVLLSGWSCTAYVFRHTLPALAAAGFRAMAVELKGQGLSDKPLPPSEYALESLAAHVGDVLDALGLRRLALVGHSLGGAIATRVALAEAAGRAPRRTERLALLSPVGFGTIGLVALAGRLPASLGPLVPYLSFRWMWRVGVTRAYAPSARPTRRDVDEYWSATSDPAYSRSLLSLVREVDWKPVDPEMLRSLTLPLLVLFGAEDRIVSPREVERVLGAVSHARTVRLPGVGHAVQEVAPDAVNRALIDFLRAGIST